MDDFPAMPNYAKAHRRDVIALLQGGKTGHQLMAYVNPGNAKLNLEAAREIRMQWRRGRFQREIARDYGICQKTVSNIVNHATHREIVLREETRHAHS